MARGIMVTDEEIVACVTDPDGMTTKQVLKASPYRPGGETYLGARLRALAAEKRIAVRWFVNNNKQSQPRWYPKGGKG